ncbi:MAG: caspase family protein [Tabrizicola sp.]|uniref:caspase family protein n=1 Tax=Tabrizicola sp. TaxID=2005166 RepID=UPI002AB805B3|nr:caspase family protein [Tabrizicola sp.]MDZ4088252.1 caspase family protein [Tabrizicola sp.]
MSLEKLGVSRRSLVIAAAAVATVISLGLGANAALNKISGDAKQAVSSIGGQAAGIEAAKPSRIALVIGNSRYPDANAPLVQPINDARALTAALRRDGFEVDVVEDANKEDLRRAVDRLTSKVRRDSVVMLFYGGYGMQAGRESYMIPVDATIWKESDVRRHGTSIESVLGALKDRGARASLVVLDAARRNPYERRFRTYSHGLSPIDAPQNALILSSATPGKVVVDSRTENSMLVGELLKNMSTQGLGAEQIFTRTRIAVSRNSDGQQVPTVSSSLIEEIRLGAVEKAGS